ncbi:MAG: hypothetical protein QXP01_05290, partial [Candidatus Hadarchaeum sp.]
MSELQSAGFTKDEMKVAQRAMRTMRKNLMEAVFPRNILSPETGGLDLFSSIARYIGSFAPLRKFPGTRQTMPISRILADKDSISQYTGITKALDVNKIVKKVVDFYRKISDEDQELPYAAMEEDLKALTYGIAGKLGLSPKVAKRAFSDAKKLLAESALGSQISLGPSPEVMANLELSRLLHQAIAQRLAPTAKQAKQIEKAIEMAEATGDPRYFEKAMTLITEADRAAKARDVKRKIDAFREKAKTVKTRGIQLTPRESEEISREAMRIAAETGDTKLAQQYARAKTAAMRAERALEREKTLDRIAKEQEHLKRFEKAASGFVDKIPKAERDRLRRATVGLGPKAIRDVLDSQAQAAAQQRLNEVKQFFQSLKRDKEAAKLLAEQGIPSNMIRRLSDALRKTGGDPELVQRAMKDIDEFSRRLASVWAKADINRARQAAQAHKDLADSINLDNVELRKNIQNKINKQAADIAERTRSKELADQYKREAEALEKLNQVSASRAAAEEKIKQLRDYVGKETVPASVPLTKRQEAQLRKEAERIRRETQSDELAKRYEEARRKAMQLDQYSRYGGADESDRYWYANDIIARKLHEKRFYKLARPYAGVISKAEMHRLAYRTFPLPDDQIQVALRAAADAERSRTAFDVDDLFQKLTREYKRNMEAFRQKASNYSFALSQQREASAPPMEPQRFTADELARIENMVKSIEYGSAGDRRRAEEYAKATVLSQRLNKIMDQAYNAVNAIESRTAQTRAISALQSIFPGMRVEVSGLLSTMMQLRNTMQMLDEVSKSPLVQDLQKISGAHPPGALPDTVALHSAAKDMGRTVGKLLAEQTIAGIERDVSALLEKRDVYRFMEAVGAKAYEYPTFAVLERAHKQIEFLRVFSGAGGKSILPLDEERRKQIEDVVKELNKVLGVKIGLEEAVSGGKPIITIDPKQIAQAEERLQEGIKAAREVRKVEERYKRLDISMSDLTIYMGRVGILLQVFDLIRASIAKTKEAIWDFNVQLKDSAVNISQTTLAVSRFIDANKQYLPMGEQVRIASDRASVFMKLLRSAALEARVPIEALVEGFKVSAGVAAQAGATMDETVQIVSGLVALAQTLGIPISNLAKTIDN